MPRDQGMLRTPATPSLTRSVVPVAIGHAARSHSMPTGIRFAGAVHTLSALESCRTSATTARWLLNASGAVANFLVEAAFAPPGTMASAQAATPEATCASRLDVRMNRSFFVILFCTIIVFMAASILVWPALAEVDQESAKKIEESISRKPLLVFVAKGDSRACGAGCTEWIAIEGFFDNQAAERIKNFLINLNRYDLPVFFNSNGGFLSQAISIGSFLREYRMTTGIGRTVPLDCKPTAPISNACRDLIMRAHEQQATLIYEKARCDSACVFALIGGSTRHVSAEVALLIHSPYYLYGDQRQDVDNALLKHFVITMGIDTSLVDAALAVPFERTHAMSRGEIDQFGIETNGYYETSWTLMRGVPQMPKGALIAKSVTAPTEGNVDAYESRTVFFSCSPPNGQQSQLTYRMLLPKGVASTPEVQLGSDQHVYRLRTVGSVENSQVKVLNLSFEQSREIADAVSLHFNEYGTPGSHRDINFSTSGLPRR